MSSRNLFWVSSKWRAKNFETVILTLSHYFINEKLWASCQSDDLFGRNWIGGFEFHTKTNLESKNYRPGQPNWNFDNGYSTLWEFWFFPATLNLREINFDWFRKAKNCRFNNEILSFGKISHLKMSKIAKMVKTAPFDLLQSAKINFT